MLVASRRMPAAVSGEIPPALIVRGRQHGADLGIHAQPVPDSRRPRAAGSSAPLRKSVEFAVYRRGASRSRPPCRGSAGWPAAR